MKSVNFAVAMAMSPAKSAISERDTLATRIFPAVDDDFVIVGFANIQVFVVDWTAAIASSSAPKTPIVSELAQVPRNLTEVQSAIKLLRCSADLISDLSVCTLQQTRFQTCGGVVVVEWEDDWFVGVRRQTIRKCVQNRRIGCIGGWAFSLSSRLDDQVERETNADTTFDSLGRTQTVELGSFPKQSMNLV